MGNKRYLVNVSRMAAANKKEAAQGEDLRRVPAEAKKGCYLLGASASVGLRDL